MRTTIPNDDGFWWTTTSLGNGIVIESNIHEPGARPMWRVRKGTMVIDTTTDGYAIAVDIARDYMKALHQLKGK